MALVAFDRLRMLWGALDWQHGDSPYSAAATSHGGDSAVSGVGVGARRAQLVWARTVTGSYLEDVMVTHFDFLNITGGNPDDTWTTGDYNTLQNDIATWWSGMQSTMSTRVTLREVRWYRIGEGITPPNPPTTTYTVGTAGSGTGDMLPPQLACAVTFKTAVRHSWGRTYLPGFVESSNDVDGRIDNTTALHVATIMQNLVTDAAGHDFRLVVYSKALHALLNVETIQVDNTWDIIRSRRYATPTYRAVKP
jgi:hypothetical protein